MPPWSHVAHLGRGALETAFRVGEGLAFSKIQTNPLGIDREGDYRLRSTFRHTEGDHDGVLVVVNELSGTRKSAAEPGQAPLCQRDALR